MTVQPRSCESASVLVVDCPSKLKYSCAVKSRVSRRRSRCWQRARSDSATPSRRLASLSGRVPSSDCIFCGNPVNPMRFMSPCKSLSTRSQASPKPCHSRLDPVLNRKKACDGSHKTHIAARQLRVGSRDACRTSRRACVFRRDYFEIGMRVAQLLLRWKTTSQQRGAFYENRHRLCSIVMLGQVCTHRA